MALSYNSAEQHQQRRVPACSLFSTRYVSDTVDADGAPPLGRDLRGVGARGSTSPAIGVTQTVTCANTPATCYEPSFQPQIVSPLNTGLTIAPRTTLRVTYQVTVDANPPSGLNEIRNDVTVTTTQNPTSAGTTLRTPLVRAAVDVEPNNAGYASAGTTINFTHTVTNRGNQNDAYALTVTGEWPWRVDLVDPDTGVVIASDTNSDGTWDAGTLLPSTGSLAPGASKEYQAARLAARRRSGRHPRTRCASGRPPASRRPSGTTRRTRSRCCRAPWAPSSSPRTTAGSCRRGRTRPTPTGSSTTPPSPTPSTSSRPRRRPTPGRAPASTAARAGRTRSTGTRTATGSTRRGPTSRS